MPSILPRLLWPGYPLSAGSSRRHVECALLLLFQTFRTPQVFPQSWNLRHTEIVRLRPACGYGSTTAVF